jgi:hypothetical protein
MSKTDMTTGIISPAVGEIVVAEFLNPIYGTLDQYEITVPANGLVAFNYTSPDRVLGLTEANITFYKKDDFSTLKKTMLKFPASLASEVARLYIVPQVVRVTEDGASQEIKFITVNTDNVGIAAQLQLTQLENGDGNDYGSFDQTQVLTNLSGEGSVIYTAPDIIANQPDRNVTVTVMNNGLEENMTFQYIAANAIEVYEISVTLPSTLSVDGNENITVSIHETGNPSLLIDPENVLDVNVSVARFANMIELPANSPSLERYNYNNSDVEPVLVHAKTISGVVIIDVNATVFDGENNVTITKSVPLTIMSGPIASLSKVYERTDISGALFNDHLTIHAVDKYGNPANSGNQIHPSLICGGAEANASDATSLLYYDGQITAGTSNTIFRDTTNTPFANTIPSEERVMILPWNSAYSKDYLGGWTIEQKANNQRLDLSEEYYGDNTHDIWYITGDQDRLLNNNIATAHIVADTGYESYKTDENGIVKVVVVYDPVLVGHTYALSAVSYNNQTRSGTSGKETFRGNGYIYDFSLNPVPLDGNTHNTVLSIAISPTGEWLDNVYITPSSISFSSTDCQLDSSTDLHVQQGHVTLVVNTTVPADPNDPTECTVDWAGSNGSIYYEY